MSRVIFEDSVFEQVDNGFEEEEKKQTYNAPTQTVKELAAQETKYLTISKAVVIFSIVLAAALVSTGTYIFLKQEEDDDYNNSYNHFTNTARDAVEFHVRNTYLASRSLSATLTAEAHAMGMQFPLVTYPSFETLAAAARAQGSFELIYYSPVVNEGNLTLWNSYSVQNQDWVNASREAALSSSFDNTLQASDYVDSPISPGIFFGLAHRGIPRQVAPDYGPEPWLPIWMQSPPPFRSVVINFDLFMTNKITIGTAFSTREGVMNEVKDVSGLSGNAYKAADHESFHGGVVDKSNATNAFEHPHTSFFTPVFAELNDRSSEVVGLISVIIAWDRYLQNLLPEGVSGLICVLKNSCGQSFTYSLNGNSADYLGPGDLHDSRYDGTEVVLPFHDFLNNETKETGGHCVYSYHLYSSRNFEEVYRSNIAVILTVVLSCTFCLMIVTFFFYDWFVKRRNTKVLDLAARTSAIVSSLFPSNVRDRLLDAGAGVDVAKKNKEMEAITAANRTKLKNFLQSEAELESSIADDDNELNAYGSKPIADIFPDTTVIFADIVGFTAWSSTREPTQVFTLLENIYKAFDDIANRRRVFKVETVGDCYVAVCGLPDPRTDHAVVMCRFARACLRKFQELVHRLEIQLGPDTADLSLRTGLHSGPVTAGVLRGERARFQLFGDTMNTASRMESTGSPGKIQVSQETADLLVAAGKGSWMLKREDQVVAKGKGQLQTYWLATESDQLLRSNSIVEEMVAIAPKASLPVRLDKNERLVKWNCDLLVKLLKEVEAARELEGSHHSPNRNRYLDLEARHGTVLDEVKEIIRLPHLASNQTRNASSIILSAKVEEQLQSYIGSVAMLYQDNPFHCFEHASHVTMSVSKLMSRIIAPDLFGEDVKSGNMASTLHDHTYGITSDPLTQFACVFSALIHDVDHSGVPNTQLARENPRMAELYGGRSIAEQNSVDLAWNLLMGPEFADLRHAIYQTPGEESRFRQLVVNSVMATDIMDKDLKQLRNARWERAFSTANGHVEESPKDVVDRKATIVIEHLIQASDVAHTMQHWHIYRKWNQKLYTELYAAYVKGRADRDPAEFWYQGELGFFDFYIIPLAKKLKDCGVFGVSSDEYLNYALKNRAEWEQRGREVVAEMVNEMNVLYPTPRKAAEPAKAPPAPKMSPNKPPSTKALHDGVGTRQSLTGSSNHGSGSGRTSIGQTSSGGSYGEI